jgi:hypothetical protein
MLNLKEIDRNAGGSGRLKAYGIFIYNGNQNTL